jgi:hypothetical protein
MMAMLRRSVRFSIIRFLFCTAKIRPEGKTFLATGFFVDRSGIFAKLGYIPCLGRESQ